MSLHPFCFFFLAEWIWASLKEAWIALHLICALYAIKRDVCRMKWALQSRGVTQIDLCETGMAPHMRPTWLQKKHIPHQKSPTVQRCYTNWFVWHVWLVSRELQYVAVCGSVLHCVAVCCSVLRIVCWFMWDVSLVSHGLQCVAVCCSVLQCVKVCCSVMQSVVACVVEFCCSVLNTAYVCHDSFVCDTWLTWLLHTCTPICSCVYHDSVSLCAMPHWCVPWLER